MVRNTAYDSYNAIKEAHPDDIVLFQVGDFFEIYGEDAKQAAELLDLNLTTREIPGAGRVEMCGVPSHNLEMYVEKLRDKYDVTIAEAPDFRGEYHIYTLRSVDHEAEAAINAQEAEFGADGTRIFRDPAADAPQPTVQERLEHYRPVVMAAVSEDTAYRNACGHSDRENAEIECNAAVRRAVLNSKDMELIQLFSDVPEFRNHLHQEVFEGTYERLHDLLRPLSQDDIDDALCAWNGNIESKHAVVRYMQQHGREKETAAWLAHEYGGKEGNNLFIVRAGSPETAELTWSKVQRRIAQLIREDNFYTETERDSFDDIDPIAIREALAQRGIVGGKVVDSEKLNSDPFIHRVMQDAERVAEQALMEQAKGLISDFCRSEYGSEADFSDPAKIGVAYTTVTDDEIPIQVNIDLVNYRLERYLDDEHLETRQYHIEDLMGRSVFALSGGEKQKIACASSSVLLPGIMVLDEPSSNLDMAAIDDLRQVLSLWKKQGKTILIAEHRLYYLHDLADRVLYVKDGEIEREYTPAEFDSLSDGTRKEMGLRPFSLSKLKPANQYQAHTAKQMEFQNFCFAYKKREPESLHIPSAELPVGETIAIIGLNGAGKSTLARCICGLEKKCGLLQVDGKTLDWKARLKHCYMVMQDTSHQLFTESVTDEVLLSIDNEDETVVDKILKQFDLLEYKDRHPLSLSGGQKQRVAIASAIVSNREIIVFDEPTSGLDLKHMREVARSLKSLADQGKTLLVITHDPELVMAGCSYVVHMEKGQIKESYPLDESGSKKVLDFFRIRQ